MPSAKPYGLTYGINPGTYPVPLSSYLPQQVVNWAVADGHGTIRIQIDSKWIWRNQSDPWQNWSWAPLDDAISKIKAAGLSVDFPLRGFPSWALTNTTYQATDEPYFLPDPAQVTIFAQGVASRYNGVYNIPGYGPLLLDYCEIFNEDGNIHFTSSTTHFTLNQAITPNTSYSTIAITASTIAIPSGIHLQFGTSGGSGDSLKLTSAVNIGDTVVNVGSTSGGTYTSSSSASYASGSNLTVVYYGLRTSPYAEYNGINGVLNAASPTPQPARDPWFMQQAILSAAPAIRAICPSIRVGMGAIWWMWDTNFADFITGLGASALAKIDFLNFHFYSNGLDPLTSSGHAPSLATAVTNMRNSATALGFPAIDLWLTEFGYQVPTDCDEPTQATRYFEVMDYCRTSGKVQKAFLYTYDASTTPLQSSLYQWNGSSYTPRQALTNSPNGLRWYTTQYPEWGTSPSTSLTLIGRDGLLTLQTRG